jgi:hypothetical protein
MAVAGLWGSAGAIGKGALDEKQGVRMGEKWIDASGERGAADGVLTAEPCGFFTARNTKTAKRGGPKLRESL